MSDKKSNTFALLPVVMLSLALALRQMSMTIVAPFISTYCKTLTGYTPFLAGLAIGAFGLMQAIFQIPFGMLSDRFGNKKMMLIGLLQVIAGLLLAYFASNMGMLILARVLQGSGAIIGVGYSWVAGMAEGSHRAKALGILGAFTSAAAALAFAVGPLLRGVMSVNKMFLAGALLLFLNSLYILIFIDEGNTGAKREAPRKEHVFLLLREKDYIIMNLEAFINNYMMMSVFYLAPIYITDITGQEGMWKVFVPAVFIAVLFMKGAVSLAERGFEKIVLIISFTLSPISILFYLKPASYLFLLTGTILFMCSYITIATMVATRVNSKLDDSLRGTGNGIFNSFQYVGSFAGAVITGAVWGISERLSWLVLIGIGCIGVLTAVFSVSKKSIPESEYSNER